jgi:hypothetical protein
LDYLQGQGWKPARRSTGGRLMGLCPLHTDHRPSFLADPGKNVGGGEKRGHSGG